MFWVILGLLIYLLIGYLIFDWAIGRDFTVSHLREIIIPVALWPFYLRFLFWLRVHRMMTLG